jgi:hypothetical protein
MRSGFWWSRTLGIFICRRGGNKRVLKMGWEGIGCRRGKVGGYFEIILFLVLRWHCNPLRTTLP